MNSRGTWEGLVVDLSDLAVRFNGSSYLYESLVVLSPGTVRSGDRVSAGIRVTRFDDEAARVESGLCLNMVVDYVTDDPTRPSMALGLVEAICSGNAEEHSLIDSEGRWIGVYSHAWGPTGSWSAGDLDEPHSRAIRRFPAWV